MILAEEGRTCAFSFLGFMYLHVVDVAGVVVGGVSVLHCESALDWRPIPYLMCSQLQVFQCADDKYLLNRK